MTGRAVHYPFPGATALCGVYHACGGVLLACDEDEVIHPEWVTCERCLRIMAAQGPEQLQADNAQESERLREIVARGRAGRD
jgi:hypothetical protein